MTASKDGAAEKILRIGIIHQGRVVEEVLVHKRQPVTVGRAAHNTVVLPGDNAVETLRVFEFHGGAYALHFPNGMQGRLMVGESAVALADLQAQQLATRRGDRWRIGLTEQSQGKLQLGDTTLLFQFVTPPPAPSRAVVPAVAHGGLLRGADPMFSMLVAGSLACHFGLAFMLANVPPPPAATLEDVPDRILKFLLPNIPSKAPPPPAASPKPVDNKPVEQKAAQRLHNTLLGAANPTSVRDTVNNSGLLKALVSRGAGSAFASVFASTGPAQGLGEMLSQAGGVEISPHDDGALQGPRASTTGNAAMDIRLLGIPGGSSNAAHGVGQRQQVQVRALVEVTELPDVEGDLDPRVVARIIRARMAGFKACYENALKRSPRLQGKVTVGFAIGEDGRVEHTEVEADTLGDAEVARCVTGLVKRTRFPSPSNGVVQASFPFVFVNADG